MTKIGIRLPTGTRSSLVKGAPILVGAARRVEELGFDSIWCLDHLLRADYMLGDATLDPVVVLGCIAGGTNSISMGTAVLVAPLRDQLWLLKQLGTLSALAGDRILLGLGAGWDDREFAAAGVLRSARAQRLDQVVAALAEARATGHLKFSGVDIEPAPSQWKGVYIGGGSSGAKREQGRPAVMMPGVLRRIARADGWVVRSTALAPHIKHDLPLVREARAQAGADRDCEVVRTSFIHLSSARSDADAQEEQMRAYSEVGWNGSVEEFASTEFHGTAVSVVDQLLGFRSLGVTHFVLHPIGDFYVQVERIAKHILPALVD